MIDTHTHIYMSDSFPDGGKAVVARALDAGVDMMVMPNVDRESVEPILALHRECPGETAVAMGLHPTEVLPDWREELREILERGAEADWVAIGEVGVDLHWDTRYIKQQMDAFGEQIQLALERELPVIVHSRDALEETIEVIGTFSQKRPTFVFHSFTAGIGEAEKLLQVAPEAYFGINGVITFKNAAPLREAVSMLPMERLVTETDAPYLAPVPHRGQTNESAYIPYIVKSIAGARGIDPHEVAEATVANARRLFSLTS